MFMAAQGWPARVGERVSEIGAVYCSIGFRAYKPGAKCARGGYAISMSANTGLTALAPVLGQGGPRS